MAEKIKAFFNKKKMNAKFMNAGKGYKLTDSSSSSSGKSSESKEPMKRVEPTQEAKIAGQAALARFEAKKTDPTKFNTSYAAIQARVKRELEIERKSRENAEKQEKPETVGKQDTKTVEEIKDNALLAVAGVFFRCPTISDEVLTWDEWKKKIRDFLYEQLNEEEAGLTSCLIIANCNKGKERVDNCVETLGKYLTNIFNNPDVEKYRKIRMCNKIFQEKVAPIEGALEFLKATGFEKKRLMNNDVEEDYLVWNPEKCGIDDLQMLYDALRSAEQIPIELDRNLQVLLPSQANERNELPPSFFSISAEELKREQQLRTEAVERNLMLRTKAMRERDEEREMRKYRFSLIRIKFPDSIILQGTFSVHDKFRAVVEFVRENLINSEISFTLLMPVRQTITEENYDKTLLDLKLIPAALLLFSQDSEGEKQNTNAGYLKEEVLCYIQNV